MREGRTTSNKEKVDWRRASANPEIVGTPAVGIIMGSSSDLPVMQAAAEILNELEISNELRIVSAHRAPEIMIKYVREVEKRGIKVLIAGAGGAAHLPGMAAALTIIPVIGVPINSSNSIQGWDSILSILQMPAGIPVATVALDGARNAGILAAQMIAITESNVKENLKKYRAKLQKKVEDSSRELSEKQ